MSDENTVSITELVAGSGTYIVDVTDGTEIARLIDQEHLVREAMGGVLPDQPRLRGGQRVLDLACGPGSWARELAAANPTVEVSGVDSSDVIVRYASALAQVQALPNVEFAWMDIRAGLDFPWQHFHLVNGRFLASFLPREGWPALLRECVRVTRPGGVIRLTESEQLVTNKPACVRLASWVSRALWKRGQTFSPDGESFCLTPVLPSLLRQAGCERVQYMPYALDVSEGTPMHTLFCENVRDLLTLLHPLLVNLGITTNEELTATRHEADIELLSGDFCGMWYLLTAWGYCPA